MGVFFIKVLELCFVCMSLFLIKVDMVWWIVWWLMLKCLVSLVFVGSLFPGL